MGLVNRGWIVAVAVSLVGCPDPATTFQCDDNASCRDGANQGECQPTGFCSFTDDQCASGTRYGEASGDLSGLCVDPIAISGALSTIEVSAPDLLACTAVTVTLTARDANSNRVTTGGNSVQFAIGAGGSDGTFGPVVDHDDGTYSALFLGSTVGGPANVTATVDGDPVATPLPTLEVEAELIPISGLVLRLDAGRVDGTTCSTAGTSWVDTANATTGTLEGVAATCTGASGWCGSGLSDDPFRLALDGIDDLVDFGTGLSTLDYTIVIWMRRRAVGVAANTGTGGIDIVPIFAKGTAEAEDVTKDINYMIGITGGDTLGVELERDPDSLNVNAIGVATLTSDTWHQVVLTYDRARRRTYLDGVLDLDEAQTATPSVANASRVCLGCSRTTTLVVRGHLAADVALAAVYTRALSSTEITSLCREDARRLAGASCP